MNLYVFAQSADFWGPQYVEVKMNIKFEKYCYGYHSMKCHIKDIAYLTPAALSTRLLMIILPSIHSYTVNKYR